MGLAMSSLSLAVLSVDKLVFFRWPLTYLLFTKTIATVICGCILAISVGLVVAIELYVCVISDLWPAFGLFQLCSSTIIASQRYGNRVLWTWAS